MEIAIVSFGIFFTYNFHFLQVIYTIGASMILLAALQFLPTWGVATYGLAVTFLHNLLDPIELSQLGHFGWLWKLLVIPGPFLRHGHLWAMDVYPVLPWSGVMALGYAFGVVVLMPAPKRRRVSLQLGAISLALFAALRFTNAYGDFVPFKHLGSFMRTTMSFFDVSKYPPSLQYLLVTLGILLILFAIGDYVLERRRMMRALGVIEVYGRVPFFYYVPHFYIIHLAALFYADGRDALCACAPGDPTLQPVAAAGHLLAADRLSHLALGGRAALPALPLVRGREGAQARLVVELSIEATSIPAARRA